MIILLISEFFMFNSLMRPLEAQAHTARESDRVDFETFCLCLSLPWISVLFSKKLLVLRKWEKPQGAGRSYSNIWSLNIL